MFPNLWLIGPPKAGTSTLFSLLSQHPSVVSSSPKETFYLLDQEFGLLNSSSNYWREGAEGWTQFFELSTKKAEYILEGTTHLLYQEETLKVIASMGGESKAIAVYRDPADRVMSSFFFTRDMLGRLPQSITFSQYVTDLLKGNSLDYVSHRKSKYILEQELHISTYSDHLKRWKQELGSSNVLLISFEDLIERQEETTSLIFSWLGLDPISIKESSKNKTLSIKYPQLHGFLKSAFGSLRHSPLLTPIKGRYKKIVHGDSKKQKLSGDSMVALDSLRDYFKEEVEKCKKLIVRLDE
ncbi:hypothetical protein MATR_17910 [Marivirga tractuosa]|uniref:Sulfotransferase n=1 Tax=Marivirga tractuosa (strain ATCC 23168 / DSM 4126 / NBRC 15989 / NCIMB 1408 / VKM B-1430 / H-43) TaxID=643867 RepID=E4TQM4_MARTH|nr:sulfotransferase domain-containing protein [Marivirga tractuosa]ADR20585.1 sulfotransferase [Marivirga tractuosa DSM 4126]BDD14966.1 hypothetical protein MATR_17910 [Marivirga tractuosa]